MPALAVGMVGTRENYAMPTASVGMAPYLKHPSTTKNYFEPPSATTRNP
jgi:hypothetical protein